MRVTSTLPKFRLQSSEDNALLGSHPGKGQSRKYKADTFTRAGDSFHPHFQFRQASTTMSGWGSITLEARSSSQEEAIGRKSRSKCSPWLEGSAKVGILSSEVARNFLQFAFAQIVHPMHQCQYLACGTVWEFCKMLPLGGNVGKGCHYFLQLHANQFQWKNPANLSAPALSGFILEHHV